MDDVLERLTDWASETTFDRLTPAAVLAARERLVDSLGCAVGAWGCENSRIGLRVARTTADRRLAGRVIGSSDSLSADSATFVNGCLIRDRDFNDTYPGGHPSDCLAALFAVAGQRGATGHELITATVVAYEVFIRIQMAGQLREKGWDNGFGIAVGTTAGLARLIGLDRSQTRHAIAITATSIVPMRASRAGMLSMWKGAATAFATQGAVLACQLAAAGMTGPEAPFTGRHGLADLITGPLDSQLFGSFGRDFYIPRAKIKYWPVVYNMQALVWAAIELRERADGRDLTSIEVQTYWSAWHESGSEPAKWDPQTRETADHSLPYIFAWTLRHGSIGAEAFEPTSYLDPTLRPLMNKVKVEVAEDIEAVFPQEVRMRVAATETTGTQHEIVIVNPLGHELNPASRAEIDAKFVRQCEPVLGEARTRLALQQWWSVADDPVGPALDLVVVDPV
jgi:2-methylcitrate dehydratase